MSDNLEIGGNPGGAVDEPTGTETVLTADELAKANTYREANGQPKIDANGKEVAPAEGSDDNDDGGVPQRPEHIPEKFWDAEKGEVRLDEVLKANAELEKKLGAPKETPKESEGTPTPLEAFDNVAARAAAEFEAGRELTDEIYNDFEKLGFPKERVDEHIAGQKALAEIAASKVFAEAGGVENYTAAIQWAKANYAKADQDVYDRDVKSNDEAVRLNAVRGLMARYTHAVGTGGRDVTKGGASGATEGYRSGAEMRADMAKKEYKKDPAFRAEVQRKVQAALSSGVELSI